MSELDELAFERRKQHAARVFVVATAGMLLVAAVVGYVVYRNRPATDTPYEVARPQVSTPSNRPAAAPAAPTRGPSVGAETAGGRTPAGAMQLELHATSACRIDAQVDGQPALNRVLRSGERTAFTVQESAVLSIGDSAAVELFIDGRRARTLGRRGEARTVRITRETIADYLR